MCIFITLYTNHCAMLYRAYIIIQPSNSYMAKLRYLIIITLSNFRSSEYNRNSFSKTLVYQTCKLYSQTISENTKTS